MGYAEKRPGYYLARYKVNGTWITVKNSRGETVRYGTKRAAKAAANAEEVKVRERTWRDPAAGRITFGAWANRWYARQELAQSMMQNYKHLSRNTFCPRSSTRASRTSSAPTSTSGSELSERPDTPRHRCGHGARRSPRFCRTPLSKA